MSVMPLTFMWPCAVVVKMPTTLSLVLSVKVPGSFFTMAMPPEVPACQVAASNMYTPAWVGVYLKADRFHPPKMSIIGDAENWNTAQAVAMGLNPGCEIANVLVVAGAPPTTTHTAPSNMRSVIPSHQKWPRMTLGGAVGPKLTPAFAPGYQGGCAWGGGNQGGQPCGGHPGGGQGNGGMFPQGSKLPGGKKHHCVPSQNICG